jgi:uncharacterized C2H2 Zn-finger protein
MSDHEKKCEICGQVFENSEKLNQHQNKSHKENMSKETPKVRRTGRYKATGIAAAIAIIIVLAVYFSENPSSSSTSNVMSNVIPGVQCEPLEGTMFHIHAHLDLFVNEKIVTIPAGIGIKPNECLYWIHTHDTSGVIHIESPQQMRFTLSQFIEVWDNTAGISPKFGELTNDNKDLKIFVNGTEIHDTYDKIVLSSHDEIVIVSGKMPDTIPSSYSFGRL